MHLAITNAKWLLYQRASSAVKLGKKEGKIGIMRIIEVLIIYKRQPKAAVGRQRLL